MKTSKEIIPASSHLSCSWYKIDVWEKARIVGKESNVIALPGKQEKAWHKNWPWDLMKDFNSASDVSWEKFMHCWVHSPPCGSPKPPVASGHKERCNRCYGTEGWWYITKAIGTETQILLLAGKLQGRNWNHHQHAWRKGNSCAELTAPLQQQSEAKCYSALPVYNNPLLRLYWELPHIPSGKESVVTGRNKRHWVNLWTIYLEKILLTFILG